MSPTSLNITYKTLTTAEAAKRITGYESETMAFLATKPGAPADSEQPMIGRDVERVETPVRIYSIDDFFIQIVVPEAFASELDAVRRFRLGLEGVASAPTQPLDPALLRRALPEDFIALLDTLPYADLIHTLFLLNEANPFDPWHRRASGNPSFRSQASTRADNGSITFFMKDVDDYIGEELRHEWSHLASEAFAQRSGFDLAADYEGKAYIPRDRAAVDANERWAVLLGEEMLSAESSRFLALTGQAPLQSLFLAECLKHHMGKSEGQHQSTEAEIRARLAYVDNTIRPRVIDGLADDARASVEKRNNAARLLIRLSEGARLNALPEVNSLDLSGEPIGARILSSLLDNTHLKSLDLSSTYTSDVPFLQNMPLRTLSLSRTCIRNSALRDLEPIATLESLDVSYCDIGMGGIPSLSRMRNLKHLDVRGLNFQAYAFDWLRKDLPNTEIIFSEKL